MEVPKSNIMIDIETLGTGSEAMVLSVGAVAFTPVCVHSTFYVEMSDLEDQQNHGRYIDISTLQWWNRQNNKVRDILSAPNDRDKSRMETTKGMLLYFSNWVRQAGGDCPAIWGNGAGFDNVIMASLYKSYGVEVPWKFWQDRCHRTMKSLFPDVSMPTEDETVDLTPGPLPYSESHNALFDAARQALHLMRIFGEYGEARLPA